MVLDNILFYKIKYFYTFIFIINLIIKNKIKIYKIEKIDFFII